MVAGAGANVMLIERILNNNAIMARNQSGEEIIVKGKGIAFQKRVGEQVEDSRIEKIFVSNSQETNRRYQEILVTIPLDYIEVCERIIEMFKGQIKVDLSDKIYVTLTDHVSNLLERLALGISFDNSLLWDVKRLYVEEYQLGLKAVEIINKAFDVRIPQDEASFIALHIVNARLNSEFNDVVKITGMIEDVYDIVESTFDLCIDQDSLDYSRFIIHLRVFFERIYRHENYQSPKDTKLLEILKIEYPEQYRCVAMIMDYVGQRYDQNVSGEILYLLVHVIKLTAN